MDNQKRLLLAIALSFGLTLVWSKLVWEPGAKVKADAAAKLAQLDAGTPVAAGASATVDAGTGAVAALLPPEVGNLDAGANAQLFIAPTLPSRQLDFYRENARYTFSTEGAGLANAPLQGEKEREQQSISFGEGFKMLVGGKATVPPQMNLAQPVNGQPLPLAVTVVGAHPVPGNLRYQVVDETDGRLVFRGSWGPWEIEKTFVWAKKGYELALQVRVKNIGAAPATGELGVHLARAIDPRHEEASSMFGGIGNESNATCWAGEDVHRLLPTSDPPQEHKGALHYFGIDQQYFLAALFPVGGPKEGRCVLTATASARITDTFFPLTLAPGETTLFNFGGFFGPKDFELLAATTGAALVGQGAAVAPGLEKSVDFGWWAVICKLLLTVMKFFYSIFGNWGVSIILLTVVVKVLLVPLTHKAMVSAEAMKKLQPRMEEMKKKFANDKEKQNLEMMKLYQEAKVNPLGGCLPLLLQLPVWAALFTTLRTSYELYGEPFFGPVWQDLTYKDPTYILPLALGVTMVITQRFQPQMMDATQAKIMTWFMPIFFTAIMLNYPAGLALYIFTNNLLSIVQQLALRKYLEKKGLAAPLPPKKDDKKDDKKMQASKA